MNVGFRFLVDYDRNGLKLWDERYDNLELFIFFVILLIKVFISIKFIIKVNYLYVCVN